ncbi:hypothetical protein AAC387_Pa07g0969 [Persea americana]
MKGSNVPLQGGYNLQHLHPSHKQAVAIHAMDILESRLGVGRKILRRWHDLECRRPGGTKALFTSTRSARLVVFFLITVADQCRLHLNALGWFNGERVHVDRFFSNARASFHFFGIAGASFWFFGNAGASFRSIR